MGARAHGRRREGRLIRKHCRLYREWTTAFSRFGEAAKAAEEAIEQFGATVGGIVRKNRAQEQPAGAASAIAEPGAPYPTQSGGEDARRLARRSEIAERVDVAAARLGLELLPWQRELAINAILGEVMALQGGRRGGRWAVGRVIEESR